MDSRWRRCSRLLEKNGIGVGIELKVFLDTSALFAAVYSETGGVRLLLKLGEAEAIEFYAKA